jgi:hypothetical protein
MNPGPSGRKAAVSGAVAAPLKLRLYVAGMAPTSTRAQTNLDAAIRRSGQIYEVEVIDVLLDGLRGVADNVLVTPTLVVTGGQHQRVLIGDLSEEATLDTFLQGASPLA